jgi:hypothetical protein
VTIGPLKPNNPHRHLRAPPQASAAEAGEGLHFAGIA